MEKRETKKIVDSLLDLPEFEPERVKVKVTRLNMVFELQELPYDKLVKLSRESDANIHLILACVCNHPEIKRGDWYHDKMKCATPADALKKLLRKGEVDKMARAIDLLHGYGAGSVVPVTEAEREAEAVTTAVKELEKN